MAITAAATAIVGTAASIKSSRDAASAQRERGRVISASQRSEDAARLREHARAARRERARILQTSETLGIAGSSAETGAISALQTQVSANVARVSGQQKTAEGVSSLNQDLADAQVLGTLGRGVQSLGSQSFSAAGGFDNLFRD